LAVRKIKISLRLLTMHNTDIVALLVVRLYTYMSYLFSPLGKLAGRAIYFTCVNFFFFFYYEQSYLSNYCTDFHDLFTKWKVFA